MRKYETLKVLEDELGEVLKSSTGESLYYSMTWRNLIREAEKAARETHERVPEDVRCAGAVLDILGIPNSYTEADQDEKGNWIVYWR